VEVTIKGRRALVTGIRQAGGEAMAHQADVSEVGQVDRMFAVIDQAGAGSGASAASQAGLSMLTKTMAQETEGQDDQRAAHTHEEGGPGQLRAPERPGSHRRAR
jgi:hypothetical protein